MASGGGGNSSGSFGVNQATFDETGTTGAAYATLFTHTNPQGTTGAIGTIKNTAGANSLTVQETVIDKFGTTHVGTPIAVPAGEVYTLDPQTNFDDVAFPYFTSYKVEVKDTVAASHATFEIHYSGLGAIS
jgi:hypothetical protein